MEIKKVSTCALFLNKTISSEILQQEHSNDAEPMPISIKLMRPMSFY